MPQIKAIILFILLPTFSLAQVDTIFWFAAPEITSKHGDNPIQMVVTAQDYATQVVMTMPHQPAFGPNGDGTIVLDLNAFEQEVVDLTPYKNIVEAPEAGGYSNKGIQLKSAFGQPFTAYYEVDRSNNRDIFSLKGQNAFGKEFYIPTQTRLDNHDYGASDPQARNSIEIVATEENLTTIYVTLQVGANGYPAGTTFPVYLNQGETYSIVANSEAVADHLAGTYITSNKKIAITVCDDSVNDESVSGWDIIADQIVPVRIPGGEYTIGKKYIVIKNKVTEEYFYVLATEPGNTEIYVDGALEATIAQKETYAHKITTQTSYIECDKRVYVTHVGGFGQELGGALIPSIEGCKGSTQVSFTRTSSDDFYLNLLVKKGGEGDFTLEYEDGSTWAIPSGWFTQVPNTPVGDDEWMFLDQANNQFNNSQSPGVPVDEVTTIKNSSEIFQLGLYNGASTGGCKYGYFSDFKNYIPEALAANENSDYTEVCFGDTVTLWVNHKPNYWWTTSCTNCILPPNDSTYVKLLPPPGLHKFYAEIDHPCLSGPDTQEVTVAVDSLVMAYFETNDPLATCDSLSVTTNNQSIGAINGYTWLIGDSVVATTENTVFQHINTSTTPDTLNLRLIALRTCVDEWNRTAIVYPGVTADFTPEDTSGCSPFPLSFTNNTTAGSNTYKWSFDDGDISFNENPSHVFNNITDNDTTFQVQLFATTTYNCKDTATKTIRVFPELEASFSTNKIAGCAPLEIDVTNLSTLAKIDSTQWVWGDGDTTKTTSPGSHIYQNTSDSIETKMLYLEVFSDSGCCAIDSIQITVYPQVVSGFEQDLLSVCDSSTVTFTDTSSGAISSKKWDFGDGVTLSNVSDTNHVYRNLTNDSITLTVKQIVKSAQGCTDTTTNTVTVQPRIQPVFNADVINGCGDLTINLTNNSDGPISNYAWNWGDGTIVNDSAPSPHTYANDSNIIFYDTIQLVVENVGGCTKTALQPIEVYPRPDSTFITDITSGCNPLTVEFTHTPSPYLDVTRIWDFDDGITDSDSTLFHTFVNTGDTTATFNTTLTVETNKGCTTTDSATITVAPYLNAQFEINDTLKKCSPFVLNITNNSSGGIDDYRWKKNGITFSTVAAPPQQIFYNYSDVPVDTTITLVITNSGGTCVDSISKTITIYPEVTADFTPDIDIGCHPQAVQFTYNPIHAAITVSYDWDFGDTASSAIANPAHTYINTSDTTRYFYPQLTIESEFGCSISHADTITVYSEINAVFNIDSVNKGCSPFTVDLTNNSTGGITSYTWKKNGITFSNINNPSPLTFINQGATKVDTTLTLIIDNAGGCLDSVQHTVTIYPEVDATFTEDTTYGCNPLTVNFQHTPAQAVSVTRLWEFGDTVTSSLTNPSHVFKNLADTTRTFTTSLFVESQYECRDTFQQTIQVLPYINAEFSLNNHADDCSPFTLDLTNNSTGGISGYTWKKDDVVFSSIADPGTPTLYNTDTLPVDTTITLVVQNSGGCLDSIQRNITIYPEVDASFTHDIDTGCSPLTVNFTHNPVHPEINVNTFWEFGDTSTSVSTNPNHTYTNLLDSLVTFTPSLLVTSDYGCTDTVTDTVAVYSYVKSQFSVNKTKGCSPLTLSFTNNSEGGVSQYEWLKNDIQFANSQNPSALTLYNTGTTAIDTIISLVVSNGNCTDTMEQTITIYPEVDAAFIQDITIGCNPLNVNFQHNPSSAINVDWFWEFGDTASSTLQNPGHTFINLTSTTQTYNTQLVVTSIYGCTDTSTQTISVYPKINASFSIDNDASGCSPFDVSITNGSTGGVSGYSWLKESTEFDTTATPGTITLYNTDTLAIDTTIILIVENTGGCTDTATREVTIYPEVNASFTHDTAGCTPFTTAFNFTPIHPEIDVDMYWEFGDTVTSSVTNPSHTYTNTTSNLRTFNPVLNVVSEHGCTATDTSTIEVYPYVDAQFNIDNATKGCSPFQVSFTNTSPGGIDQYQWMKNGILFDSVQHPTAITLYNTDTVAVDTTITLVVGNTQNCTDTMQRTVTIYPEVDAAFTPDTAGCNPLTVQFHHTPVHPEISVSTSWDFGDTVSSSETNPLHIYNNRTNSTKTYTPVLDVVSAYGCTATDSATINVYPYVEAQFSIDSITKGCSPFRVSFTNHSIGGISQYRWMKNGIVFDSAQNPATITLYNKDTLPVDTTITLVVANANNCTDTIQRTVTIYPEVDASFTPDTAGCNPLAVQFHHTPVHSEIDVNTYWDFGDTVTSSLANPLHLYDHFSATSTIYHPILNVVSEFGCTATDTATVEVFPYVEAQFSIDSATKGCSPFRVAITNHSIGGISQYRWMKNGIVFDSVQNPATITLYNKDTLPVDTTITLVVANGNNCTDTIQRTVTIYPEVDASFTPDTVGCNPLAVQFHHTPVHSEIDVNTYWDFGDTVTSSLANPLHLYDHFSATSTIYRPVLNVVSEFGCTATDTATVEVFPYVEAQFSIDSATKGCSPFRVSITNHSIGGISQYRWMKNGIVFDSVQNPATITLYNKDTLPVDTTITLVVANANSCTDTIQRTVTIHPEVDASFTPDTAGCNPLAVQFHHTPVHPEIDVNTYWDFGDTVTSSLANPLHLYDHFSATSTIYRPVLNVVSEFGCTATDTATVEVFPYVEAQFSIDSATKGCSPFRVSITNHSIGGISQYRWMKNGIVFDSVQNPATITLYNKDTLPVDTTITLVVANGNNCTDTIQRTVTIYPEVDASFTPDTAGCNPLAVQFHHTPVHPEINVKTYWDFGDTVTSSLANPLHLYDHFSATSTIYRPVLNVVSEFGCTATDTATVEVFPYVEAQFSIDSATKGCSPFRVSITNHSIGGISQYTWMKNGIVFDSVQNPAAITLYNKDTLPVDTTITLVVANANNCTDTMERKITIYPEVDASFTPDTAGCNPLAVQFHHTPIHPEIDVNTYWDFGDTVTSSLANPMHLYENRTNKTATFTPTLNVVSEYGCSAIDSSTVQVYPYIEALFSIDSVTKGCSPFQISFTNHSIGGIFEYRWYKNDILFSNQEHPVPITLYNTGANPVDTTITLVVLNADRCTDTIQRTVTIYPEVDANFTTDVNDGCTPLTVNFEHDPVHDIIVTWDWNFGDTVNSTIENPTHEYVNLTETIRYYTAQLNVTSQYGCTDSSSHTIQVYSHIDAQYSIVEDAQGCSPFSLDFVNDSKGNILEYTWKKNDIIFSTQETPSTLTLYNRGINPVDTTITLIIANAGDCLDSIQRTVTIYPEVDATFTTDVTEGCDPLTVNFTHNPIHPEINVNWNWTFGDNSSSETENPVKVYDHRENTQQTYLSELFVESEYGCISTHSQNITVAAFIDAAIAIEDPTGCSPRLTSITNYSTGGITNYNWRRNGTTFSTTSGSPNLNFVNQTNNIIVDTIDLIVQNAGPGTCYDTSMRRLVTTYPEVTADFMVDTNRGCNPVTIDFTYTPGSNTVTVIHDWTFGDNSSSDGTNPIHEFINESYNSIATFEVVHNTISLNGCTAERKDTIIVEKALEALINADPAAGCHPYNASFTNSTRGADNYTWVFGDGVTIEQTTLEDITHLYPNTEYTFPITRNAYMIATNGGGNCIDTSQQQQITIYPDILASFTPDNTGGCHPFTINFENNTLGGYTYLWDFDDQTNTTDANPSHTFINWSSTTDSTFDVHLTATSQYYCTDDTTITVTSYHQPNSEFSIDQTSSCNPLDIIATIEAEGYSEYEWRLGTGDIVSNQSPLETQYTNTSNDVVNYTLELYTESNQGCNDSSSLVLNVYPNVTAQFSISPDSSCNPVVASFTNTSINADFSYWLFGDGTTSNLENPTNRYEITGGLDQVITATLISSSQYNCIDTTTRDITIFVQPDADFEIDPVTQTFPSSTIELTDYTNAGPFDYSWDYGDENTSEVTDLVHTHTYETWGPYEVELKVNNQNFNCKDSTSNLLIVDPPVVLAIISTGDTAGCEPHTVNLEANDPLFEDETYTYLWDFGDGSTSTDQNPSYTYDTAGNYRITLMVIGSSGESSTTTEIITVYDNPEIDFTMSPRLVMIPDDYVQCYNFTKYGNEYLWNFGDGNTSTDENPTHYYDTPGFYDVYLKATSIHSCISDTTKLQYIEVRGQAVMEFPNAFSPTGPSDGRYNETDIDNDIFHPKWEGVVEYDLYIYNRWGELMFHSDDVNIGWDGHYNNKMCPQDVYIWKAEGKFINGDTFEKSGDVTLLR